MNQCTICAQSYSENNILLSCSLCRLQFHSVCYGVEINDEDEIPSFLCQPCQLSNKANNHLTCALCLTENPSTPFIKNHNEWVHKLCLLVKHQYSSDEDMKDFLAQVASNQDSSFVCTICAQDIGLRMPCNCGLVFHPPCIIQINPNDLQQDERRNFIVNCTFHRALKEREMKLQQDKQISAKQDTNSNNGKFTQKAPAIDPSSSTAMDTRGRVTFSPFPSPSTSQFIPLASLTSQEESKQHNEATESAKPSARSKFEPGHNSQRGKEEKNSKSSAKISSNSSSNGKSNSESAGTVAPKRLRRENGNPVQSSAISPSQLHKSVKLARNAATAAAANKPTQLHVEQAKSAQGSKPTLSQPVQSSTQISELPPANRSKLSTAEVQASSSDNSSSQDDELVFRNFPKTQKHNQINNSNNNQIRSIHKEIKPRAGLQIRMEDYSKNYEVDSENKYETVEEEGAGEEEEQEGSSTGRDPRDTASKSYDVDPELAPHGRNSKGVPYVWVEKGFDESRRVWTERYTQELLGDECQICGEHWGIKGHPGWDDGNEIVFCFNNDPSVVAEGRKQCSHVAHQQCNGTPNDGPEFESDWLCELCQAGLHQGKVTCALCLTKRPAPMKPISKSTKKWLGKKYPHREGLEWVHVVCGLFCVGGYFKDDNLSEFFLDEHESFDPAYDKGRCTLCNSLNKGYKVSCGDLACNQFWHPVCGAKEHCYQKDEASPAAPLKHPVFRCRLHHPLDPMGIRARAEVKAKLTQQQEAARLAKERGKQKYLISNLKRGSASRAQDIEYDATSLRDVVDVDDEEEDEQVEHKRARKAAATPHKVISDDVPLLSIEETRARSRERLEELVAKKKATAIEEAAYTCFSHDLQLYTTKIRDILYNLKANENLAANVFTSNITAEQLVLMDNKAMANVELQQERAAEKKQEIDLAVSAAHQTILVQNRHGEYEKINPTLGIRMKSPNASPLESPPANAAEQQESPSRFSKPLKRKRQSSQ
jgi:hypothetical protein